MYGAGDADINFDCADYDKNNNLYYMLGRLNSENLTGGKNKLFLMVLENGLAKLAYSKTF